MKFPAVTKFGSITIEDAGTFSVWLVNDEWDDSSDDHSSEHARGQCECPCLPVVVALEQEAASNEDVA